jgi:hypothetical protein
MAAAFGFDTADLIVLGLAILLAALIAARATLISIGQRLANRTVICMLILGLLPIGLRLALLPHHPVPAPGNADDFSYLLLGDTLAHFRLANPMHPMHRFFEGVFILQDPTYSSIYPLGQGLVLATGQLIFGKAWAGVVLSVGLLCALCYWMLCGWVAPKWALLGGLLAVATFGPLSSWMNTYWGGAVSGIAGCLVFGALPRLKNAYRMRDAVFLGAGLGLQLLTRPFEFVLLVFIVFLFVAPVRSLIVAAAVLLPAFGLMLLQNKQVTGNWTILPYQLSRYQYGIPTTFTFQPNPSPHRALSIEQQVDYDAQTDAHKQASENYVAQLGRQVRHYRFFLLPALYLALPAFLLNVRQYRFAWAAVALAVIGLGEAFYPFFYPHYVAAEASLFLLVAVVGIEKVNRFSREAAMFIVAICVGHFVFWYGFRPGDVIDSTNAARLTVEDRLNPEPGKHLVFVHHSTSRALGEWIQNQADIDRARVIWAIDLGPDEDTALRRYYPGRKAWVVEADARPPRLMPMP